MQKRWLDHKYVAVCVSFIMAATLAMYVNAQKQSSTMNQDSVLSVQTQKVVTEIPVHVVDSSGQKYISGLPETVSVSLIGPRNVLTQLTEKNIYVSTQDMTQAGLGNQQVTLQLSNLPSNVTGQVLPTTVSVVVSNQMKKEVTVKAVVDSASVSSGYELGEVQLSPRTVVLTGSQEDIEKVDSVSVNISAMDKIETFTQENNPVVVKDKHGDILDINVDKKVSATVPIYKKGRTVPLDVLLVGESDAYQYTVVSQSVYTLMVLGNDDAVNGITKITATANVSDLTDSGTIEATVFVPSGVTISNPQAVTVEIQVEKK